jgi:hypothetical protein
MRHEKEAPCKGELEALACEGSTRMTVNWRHPNEGCIPYNTLEYAWNLVVVGKKRCNSRKSCSPLPL